VRTRADVAIVIETDKNLIVVALHAAGFTIYPINPRAAARYRERHAQAGGTSDPATRSFWRMCCARTGICTGRCRTSPRPDWRSRLWPDSIRKRSGLGS